MSQQPAFNFECQNRHEYCFTVVCDLWLKNVAGMYFWFGVAQGKLQKIFSRCDSCHSQFTFKEGRNTGSAYITTFNFPIQNSLTLPKLLKTCHGLVVWMSVMAPLHY